MILGLNSSAPSLSPPAIKTFQGVQSLLACLVQIWYGLSSRTDNVRENLSPYLCRPTPTPQSKMAMVHTICMGKQWKRVYTRGPGRRIYTIEASDPENKNRKGFHDGRAYSSFPPDDETYYYHYCCRDFGYRCLFVLVSIVVAVPSSWLMMCLVLFRLLRFLLRNLNLFGCVVVVELVN